MTAGIKDTKIKGTKVQDALPNEKWSPGKRWKEWRQRREEEIAGKTPEELAQEEARFQRWFRPPLSIDRLRSHFDQGARANRFEVHIHCPKLGIKKEDFGLRCMTASLPGRSLEAADWSAYGATQKMPYQVINDGGDVNLTFLCDQSFADRFIIDAWQGIIFASPNSKAGNGYDYELANSFHPMFSYMNDYVGEVHITQLTTDGKPSLKTILYDAYPISYQQQNLSWSEVDSVMQFECSFAFRSFTTEYTEPPSTTALNRGRRALDAILDIGNLRKGGNSANNTLQRFSDRLAKLDGIFG